ncbi:hypothetical protein NQZ68_032868 [Dissostichus eleginoides]|nr:hypothetical protein NQZ68_032868 [Dissostichus eleginoides]
MCFSYPMNTVVVAATYQQRRRGTVFNPGIVVGKSMGGLIEHSASCSFTCWLL